MSGGTNDEWNLMTLCVSCHNRVEAYTQDIMEPVFVET
jgi:5-methylcytosine-specific restriction endonuclease McrA